MGLGRAARLLRFLPSDKEYVGVMWLHEDFPEEQLKEAVKKFIGKIKQLPPKRCAVKRAEREREIYSFDILEQEGRKVLFRVHCEAGTYIRKLCLHPKTEILSHEGLIEASNFYSDPRKVYSFNEGGIIETNSSATQKINSPKKLIKITVSSGINFIITPDHELLKSAIGGYKMAEAKDLKRGDYLVKSAIFPSITRNYIVSDLLDDRYLIPQYELKQECKKAFIEKYGSIREMHQKLKIDRKAFLSKSQNAITIKHLKIAGIYDKIKHRITSFKTEKGKIINFNKLDEKSFYLLGLIASDGNNTKEKNTIRHTRLKFHNKNEILVNKFLNEYKKLFNIPISKKKVKNDLWQLDTSNSLFATIAASLGIKSPQKNSDILPILYAKPEFIKSFLRGYFDGDGTAYCKKKENSTTTYSDISLFSINYINAKRIHQMLLKLGIPNRVWKNKMGIHIVRMNSPMAKKKFINEIGTNHPEKSLVFNKILQIREEGNLGDEFYIGLHYKDYIMEEKSKLGKMGGNLSRVLKSSIPITMGFYRKCSGITNLPKVDGAIIEKIEKIETLESCDYVYDLTVPKTHNFLIETGFVSSNCHDLGESIKVGAHMLELRRTKAGAFPENESITLYQLQEAYDEYKKGNPEKLLKYLQPVEKLTKYIPTFELKDDSIKRILSGSPVFKGFLKGEEKAKDLKIGCFIALTYKNKLVGVERIVHEGTTIAVPEMIIN